MQISHRNTLDLELQIMAKLSRYHRCYYNNKKSSANLLVILLILPSFPEETCQAEYHYQRQKNAQPQYFHQHSNINNYGALRDIQGKGYYKRMHPPTPPAPTTAMTIVIPAQPQYIYQKRRRPSLSSQPLHHYSTPQGVIRIQQVPGLPPYITSAKQQRQIPLSKQKQKQLNTHHPPFPVAIRQDNSQMKCNGRKNIIDDIGLFSLLTAVMSSSFGMYTIMVNSMTSNNIGIVSGFMSLVLWLPSTLISAFNLNGDYVYMLGNLLNSMSFVNSMYGFMGVIFGTADVLASAAGESVGVISFIMSVVATFPEFLDSIIEYLYRIGNKRRLEFYIENYGCEVPGLFRWYGKSFYKLVNDFLVHAVEIKGPVEMIAAQNKMRF